LTYHLCLHVFKQTKRKPTQKKLTITTVIILLDVDFVPEAAKSNTIEFLQKNIYLLLEGIDTFNLNDYCY